MAATSGAIGPYLWEHAPHFNETNHLTQPGEWCLTMEYAAGRVKHDAHDYTIEGNKRNVEIPGTQIQDFFVRLNQELRQPNFGINIFKMGIHQVTRGQVAHDQDLLPLFNHSMQNLNFDFQDSGTTVK